LLTVQTDDDTMIQVRPSLPAAPTVHVRPVDAIDEPEVSRFYASLSPESRYRRFMGAGGYGDRDVKRICGPDHVHSEGFVAVLTGPGANDGSIVGHVCLEPTGRSVELAVAVADAYQTRGIGRRLVEAGVDWAERSGFDRLEASTLVTNCGMAGLLLSLRRPIAWSNDAGVVTASLDLRSSVGSGGGRGPRR
jgi:acetyltransferase